jgi:hypothetical protein
MSKATAELASEFWKLLKGFEKAIAMAPIDARPRLLAQARYAASRLDTILAGEDMRIVSFDGGSFEPSMPAVAINADEIAGMPGEWIVERTLEPAVISGVTVVMTGKVYLSKRPSSTEQN